MQFESAELDAEAFRGRVIGILEDLVATLPDADDLAAELEADLEKVRHAADDQLAEVVRSLVADVRYRTQVIIELDQHYIGQLGL
jgi:hypothetical protein